MTYRTCRVFHVFSSKFFSFNRFMSLDRSKKPLYTLFIKSIEMIEITIKRLDAVIQER